MCVVHKGFNRTTGFGTVAGTDAHGSGGVDGQGAPDAGALLREAPVVQMSLLLPQAMCRCALAVVRQAHVVHVLRHHDPDTCHRIDFDNTFGAAKSHRTTMTRACRTHDRLMGVH